jgi:hypothetical protein
MGLWRSRPLPCRYRLVMIAVDGRGAGRFRASSSTLSASSPLQVAETTCSSRRLRRAHCTCSPATLVACDRSAFASAPAPKRAARTRASHPQLDPPVATPSKRRLDCQFPGFALDPAPIGARNLTRRRPTTTKKFSAPLPPFLTLVARSPAPALPASRQQSRHASAPRPPDDRVDRQSSFFAQQPHCRAPSALTILPKPAPCRTRTRTHTHPMATRAWLATASRRSLRC